MTTVLESRTNTPDPTLAIELIDDVIAIEHKRMSKLMPKAAKEFFLSFQRELDSNGKYSMRWVVFIGYSHGDGATVDEAFQAALKSYQRTNLTDSDLAELQELRAVRDASAKAKAEPSADTEIDRFDEAFQGQS